MHRVNNPNYNNDQIVNDYGVSDNMNKFVPDFPNEDSYSKLLQRSRQYLDPELADSQRRYNTVVRNSNLKRSVL